MAKVSRALVSGVLLVSSVVGFAQQHPQQLKTVPDSINFIWKDIEQDFSSLAEAMPEDKWSFKPTQGEFKDVRTFGEQVKHVACANEAWAKQIAGEKPPARCDLGGPNPAKTKSEILAYLRDSFTMIDKVIADTTAENLLHQNAGPYWGSNRLSALTATVWHISNHYGQLVEYLRMNGIVPPASRTTRQSIHGNTARSNRSQNPYLVDVDVKLCKCLKPFVKPCCCPATASLLTSSNKPGEG